MGEEHRVISSNEERRLDLLVCLLGEVGEDCEGEVVVDEVGGEEMAEAEEVVEADEEGREDGVFVGGSGLQGKGSPRKVRSSTSSWNRASYNAGLGVSREARSSGERS